MRYGANNSTGNVRFPNQLLHECRISTEAGDQNTNEIQVRFDELQGNFNRYDTAQNELELLDDTDHFGDRELFENQYHEVLYWVSLRWRC